MKIIIAGIRHKVPFKHPFEGFRSGFCQGLRKRFSSRGFQGTGGGALLGHHIVALLGHHIVVFSACSVYTVENCSLD